MSIALKKDLAAKIRFHQAELNSWFTRHAAAAPPPLYSSIDLRDSGYKIAPVDSNLYPAGFNNICPEDQRTAPEILRREIYAETARMGRPQPKKILILPESNTTNVYYIENLYYLRQILVDAEFEVQIGWYPSLANEPTPAELRSESGKILNPVALQIEGGTLRAGSFIPDAVILNNDFSSGYPKALDDVLQPILPSHSLGWHTRKKSEHFQHYNLLAGEFAQIVGIEAWTIQIETLEISPVNFNEEIGIEAAAALVDTLVARTRVEYQKRGVKREPFVFVKNNSGTYGMGILMAHSGDELRKMNRRTKNKMSVGKNRMQIESVAVQEGVPTVTLVDRLAAEPVIYLFGCELIGGFLRTNTERGDEENLNSQGMVFRKLCMTDLRNAVAGDASEEEAGGGQELELVYGAIAKISALAAGRELALHLRGRN